MSSAHLLRYQDAAEKALRATIPNRPPPEFKDRRTGRQITEKIPLFKDLLGKTARLDGDTLILRARPYSHMPCATAPAPQSGRYRVRASVYAVGTNGKPLPMRCVCDDVYGRNETDVRAVRDVPVDRATVIEGEFGKQRQAIVFASWSLPTARGGAAAQRVAGKVHRARPGRGVGGDRGHRSGRRRLSAAVAAYLSNDLICPRGPGGPPAQPAKRLDSYIYDPLVPAPAKRVRRRTLAAVVSAAGLSWPVDASADYYVKMVRRKAEAVVRGRDDCRYKAACSRIYGFSPSRSGRAQRVAGLSPAARLSAFFWSSAPDADLLSSRRGKRRRRRSLRSRSSAAERSQGGVSRTTAGQWLDLRNISTRGSADPVSSAAPVLVDATDGAVLRRGPAS